MRTSSLIGWLVLCFCVASFGISQSALAGGPKLMPTPTPEPCLDFDQWRHVWAPSWACMDLVADELEGSGLPRLTSIAFGPDGRLYMARPALGSITVLEKTDADGDGLLDDAGVFADDLEHPTGLTYHGGTWYVAEGSRITALRDRDGDGIADDREILIDDLPDDGGYWPSSLAFGPDGRLYISIGVRCPTCADDERRGVIMSFLPDGSDGRVYADGFYLPFDFAWHPVTGDMWVDDTGRWDDGSATPPAELNLVEEGMDYGWPFCYGDRVPDVGNGGDEIACAGTVPPVLTFEAGSWPAGMIFYRGDAFPELDGHLLMLLAGSWNRVPAVGHELLLIRFGEDGMPTGQIERLLPYRPGLSTWEMDINNTGFYPWHPIDLAINPEGWIYIAIREGKVFRLRPR